MVERYPSKIGVLGSKPPAPLCFLTWVLYDFIYFILSMSNPQHKVMLVPPGSS